MQTIAVQLQTILRHALAMLPEPLPEEFEAFVSPVTDPRFGDYQTNVAMTLAKQRRVNPRALAIDIVAALEIDDRLGTICMAPKIEGAGFINFRLVPECLSQKLDELDADRERLGLAKLEHPKTVVIDFSSPNIAKPMHVGHLRSTILGDCLARVARFVGHRVITDNHLGDWGTQFGKVIYGWRHFLDEERLAVDPLAELVRIYQKTDAEIAKQKAEKSEEAKIAAPDATVRLVEDSAVEVECRRLLVQLQRGIPSAVQGIPSALDIWKRCVQLSRAELDRIYERLAVKFDETFGESHFNDKLAPLVEALQTKGIAQPSEGALLVFFPNDSRLADKPAMVRKSDRAFNYTTTDIATYEQRVNDLHADGLWYVVGTPQSLHFEQLNAIVQRMGYTVPLTHIPFGSILGEDRKIMRTRSGDNVALRDLLDEAVERAYRVVNEKNAALPEDEKAEIARVVGLGAVKYAELSQHRLTDYIFSWDKMLSFQGNTAPYLQNACVRILGIFRRLAETDQPEFAGCSELTEPEELRLAKKLAQFAEAVPAVLDDFRPNLLTNYLYELANDFHSFYEACPVLKAADPARSTRLTLCRVTMRTLGVGLGLLGIEVPERM